MNKELKDSLELIKSEIYDSKTNLENFSKLQKNEPKNTNYSFYKTYFTNRLTILQQIKAELEAWEIVKNKSVDIHDVIHCSSLEVFNCGLYEKYQLTEEEYNKVKKALEVEENENI